MHAMIPEASIVFTAHNRRAMVLEAIALAKAQTAAVEIIVCDDASSDGLAEALAAAHPDVTLLRSEISRGPCFQRNRGIEHASCEIVFPLDDDSMLVSPNTIKQTLAEFTDTRVAVVAMPFTNILYDSTVLQRRAGQEAEVSVNFAACAHAVRKNAIQDIGGYPEDYFYMFEESDLAIRLLDLGHRVIMGVADPLYHLQPANRRSYKADFYGRRNKLLFLARHAPTIRLPWAYLRTLVGGFWFGITNDCMRAAFDGTVSGLVASWKSRALRNPVSSGTFRAFYACRRAGSLSLTQFEKLSQA